MEETIIEAGKEQLSNALEVVSNSFTEAVTQYGPQAVDLALVVYRVDAAQALLTAAGIFICLTFVQVFLWKKGVPWAESIRCGEDRSAAKISVFGGLILLFITSAVLFIEELCYLPYWMALFGYPEVYMATKALVAAGVL